MDLGDDYLRCPAVGWGEEDAGPEAAVAIGVGRRDRNHEHVGILQQAGRYVTFAPGGGGEVAHPSLIDHVPIEGCGVEVVQIEHILVTLAHPREERRRVIDPDSFQFASPGVEGFT